MNITSFRILNFLMTSADHEIVVMTFNVLARK
jgi:hypothetical protein